MRALQEGFVGNRDCDCWCPCSVLQSQAQIGDRLPHRTYSTGRAEGLCADTNLPAHWVNLGYVEEAIRSHILQSLIDASHPTLYDHQADALIILFKLAGATLGAYANPSVVDRCSELLKSHYRYDSEKHGRVRVRASRAVNGGYRAEVDFQEPGS